MNRTSSPWVSLRSGTLSATSKWQGPSRSRATLGFALAELAFVHRMEQACLIREAALLRSALLRGTGELADALASARWFAAWQPAAPSSLASWHERYRRLELGAQADGMSVVSILRRCAQSDLGRWPTASRLAQEAQGLDPCPYGRLVVARARLVDGRIGAARQALGALQDEARKAGNFAIPRAVWCGALLTLAGLTEVEGRVESSGRAAFVLARRAFVVEPTPASAWMMFDLAIRLGRRGAAQRAAAVLLEAGADAGGAGSSSLRALRAYARLRSCQDPAGQETEEGSVWLEFMTSGEWRRFDLCLKLVHASR